MEKKKQTIYIIVITVLFAVTASVAAMVRTMLLMPPKGSITVVADGKDYYFDPAGTSQVDVSGTITNAKGEKSEINSKGYRLEDAISQAGVKLSGFSKIMITSSDSFIANLTDTEVSAPDTAFLIAEKTDSGDTALRLVVFGDSDSKRQVKNVVRIDLGK